ncbi:hypothetical protein [Arcticibacter tournemirensis]
MNNVSKFLLGLFLAALTLGGSAFKKAETAKAARATVFYLLISENQYQRSNMAPTNGNCENEADHKCWLGYSVDKGDSFSADAAPTADRISESSSNGLYIQ